MGVATKFFRFIFHVLCLKLFTQGHSRELSLSAVSEIKGQAQSVFFLNKYEEKLFTVAVTVKVWPLTLAGSSLKFVYLLNMMLECVFVGNYKVKIWEQNV